MDTNSENISVESAPAPLPETLPPPSVGKILSEEREKQGLTVADVAASIKFAPRQVIALEADDFAHLPELAFVRGFVRSYARLLHIDEVALLKVLPVAHQQLNDFQENLADVPLSASQATRKVNLVWLFTSLGLASLLGLGIWFFEEKPIEKKLVENEVEIIPISPAISAVAAASAVSEALSVASAPSVAQASKPVSSLPIAPPAVPTPAAIVTPTVVKVVPPVVVTPAVVMPPIVKTAPAIVAAPPTAKPLPTVVAQSAVAATKPVVAPLPKDDKTPQATGGQGQIHLIFKVDSWVFITDKFGKTIHKQTNAAGTEQRISGRPPYNLTIANAKNVRLIYEGEEVDLKDFTDVSVARVILE